MRSILTDAIYQKKQIMQWNKTYSTIAPTKSAMERIPLGNGIFCSISCDHKQPIKRSEFNKVLHNTNYYTKLVTQ
jgi:hypothetical protein